MGRKGEVRAWMGCGVEGWRGCRMVGGRLGVLGPVESVAWGKGGVRTWKGSVGRSGLGGGRRTGIFGLGRRLMGFREAVGVGNRIGYGLRNFNFFTEATDYSGVKRVLVGLAGLLITDSCK